MNPKKIDWRDQAKAQLRAIDQTTALRILHAVAAFAATGEGDVKRLQAFSLPPAASGPAHAARWLRSRTPVLLRTEEQTCSS